MENIDVLHALSIFRKSIRMQQHANFTTTVVAITLSLVTHRALQILWLFRVILLKKRHQINDKFS